MCFSFVTIHRKFSLKLSLQKRGYSYLKAGKSHPLKISQALYRLVRLPNIETLPKSITAQNIYHLPAPLFFP